MNTNQCPYDKEALDLFVDKFLREFSSLCVDLAHALEDRLNSKEEIKNDKN